VGEGAGKYYSVNVPLRKGMRDLEYIELFKKVMDKVMGSYRPDACVIQCGADSLAKDRLGHQNLTIKGHAECVKWMMGYGTPIVFLGGGGYTIENVSRCWAYETSVILGTYFYNFRPANLGLENSRKGPIPKPVRTRPIQLAL
jgi:histone deacetylase 1/2